MLSLSISLTARRAVPDAIPHWDVLTDDQGAPITLDDGSSLVIYLE
ncbi:MAG: hypothetical protein PHD19_11570 [Dechloromonas sp.]|nr:hypothetical protein [Dechloromonas sp.]